MKCEPTNVPPVEEIDIPAMWEKYRQERDKRLRPEGQARYIEPLGEFASAYESDPHIPVEPRAALSEDIDVAVLGATVGYIEGMSPEESRKLLVRLREATTQPQFVYRHEWTVGDLIIWSNTGAMHRAIAYPADSGRLMIRTTLEGEEPLH